MKENGPILKNIRERRSVRKFTKKPIGKKIVDIILEAGRWAPSGLNNQPWKFMILDDERKDRLATYTHHAHIVRAADKLVLVFLDKKKSYHRDKDLMAIGACVENMLLAISACGLGGCWLGEILNQRGKIQKMLRCNKSLELWGCVAFGCKVKKDSPGHRTPLKKLILKP